MRIIIAASKERKSKKQGERIVVNPTTVCTTSNYLKLYMRCLKVPYVNRCVIEFLTNR